MTEDIFDVLRARVRRDPDATEIEITPDEGLALHLWVARIATWTVSKAVVVPGTFMGKRIRMVE